MVNKLSALQSVSELVGAACILPITLLVTLTNFLLAISPGLQFSEIAYGKFGYHVFMMMLAFGTFMPISISSYVLLENIFGISHSAAKNFHAIFHGLSVIFALRGVCSMWKTHANVRHFQTSHSIIGIIMLSLYCIVTVGSSAIFFFGSGVLRAKIHQAHMVIGRCMSVVMVVVMLLGIMKVESAGLNNRVAKGRQTVLRIVNYSLVLLLITLFLIGQKGPKLVKKGQFRSLHAKNHDSNEETINLIETHR